jgi:hypothetical protein
MHSRVKISDKVEDLDVTISLTMTLAQWRQLMRQLPASWPSWKVAELIAKSVGEITTATDRLVLPAETE